MDSISVKGLPLFPLPDYFLFPGAVAPLHIFEPRYRKMISDLLDAPGRLVMASIPQRFAGKQLEIPPVFPVGTLAEILHYDSLADGRFLIWILGLARVRIEDLPSHEPYRQVKIELMEDVESDTTEDERLRPLLEGAIENYSASKVALAENLPIGALADILLHALELEPDQLEQVFMERRATRRAIQALAWMESA